MKLQIRGSAARFGAAVWLFASLALAPARGELPRTPEFAKAVDEAITRGA